MWLRPCAAELPSCKGLLNHCQVSGSSGRSTEVIRAEHTAGVHVQVKWPYRLWLYTLKVLGKPTVLLTKAYLLPTSNCLSFVPFITQKKKKGADFHRHCVAQYLQNLKKIYKSPNEEGNKVSLPSQQAGAHKRSSSLQPIN